MESPGHSEPLRDAIGMVQVWRPDSPEEAWRLKRQYGKHASYAAGGTWLRTSWESGSSFPPLHLISLDKIAALRTIQIRQPMTDAAPRVLRIGAAAPLSVIEHHTDIQSQAPLLAMAANSVAAPSVRRQATIGGNVMTRSGDLIPALLALDAVIILYSNGRYERRPLAQWLTTDGGDRDRLTISFEIGLLKGRDCWYRKLGRREAFTPSVLTIACAYRVDASSGVLSDVRLAVGGAGMVPVRLYDAETAAESGTSVSCVYTAVRRGIPSVADDYAGAAYRRMAAANVIAAELDRVYGRRRGERANGGVKH
ncbi:FAD binding domain-containing protein [Paenibacillus xylaniclasticus]|uniref:FAD binding domain-containing protein n=1 Tax=Paenibacillus xylaniclasticus TaxID=588083 RepID=UPI000FD91EF2|nr:MULTISPECIES: FAD binding domain-containing protein [Paenibacillus]GFN33672.1 putative xanthine dehydrogenase subunit C [Paenibacillus curdlanolyticus]